MRGVVPALLLSSLVVARAHAQAPSVQVEDASGCLSEASLQAALSEVLGDAANETLAGLRIEVVVTERHVGIALRRPSGLVGARSLDLGGQACDERHATLALVVAVLATSAGPESALRVTPQTRWEVQAAPPAETGENGEDLGAPLPPCVPPSCGPPPAWMFGAGYRLLPGWLPTLAQGFDASVGGPLGPLELGAGMEAFLPRDSAGTPGVRAAAGGLRLEVRLPLFVRPRLRLALAGALAAGVMTGVGRGADQVFRQRQGYVRTALGLDLALPLGRGLALSAQAGVAVTPNRPSFVAEDRTTMAITALHTPGWVTATFGLGLRWRRSR